MMGESAPSVGLPKLRTGIEGFDDITLGGLPAGRPTLVCGAAGCGKSLFAATFLVNGVTRFGETGVFMTFEERGADLAANFASLGYDFDGLVAAGKLVVDYVHVERSEIAESGEYDLEGLFVRLGFAVASVGATRIVLDTIEALFSGFSDPALLRTEFRRLFAWIKDQGLTAVITGERGDGQLTRYGLEEYVSDCVVLLDNRVVDQIATRRLRVVKYRGSAHGTNEYPYMIDADGMSVLPVTSAGITRPVSNEIVSTGVAGLDAMLRGGGFYRGSSVLLSGVSGTGKTSVGGFFVEAACRRGERSMFFAFEEGAGEMCRNLRSVGLDLQHWLDVGLLRIEEARPTLYGIEMHLARMQRDLDRFKPKAVVIDPISAFRGPPSEIHASMLRIVDLLKRRGITAIFNSLRSSGELDGAEQGLSSLMDVWIRLSDVEVNGERNRTLYLIKARGMSHSNQVREYHMTDDGFALFDPYIGSEGLLTGTARFTQEARERVESERRMRETHRRRRDAQRRCAALERQIEELKATLDAERDEAGTLLAEDDAHEALRARDRLAVSDRRRAV